MYSGLVAGVMSMFPDAQSPPCAEVVEPLEETRSELIFATEPVLSSLHLSVPGSFQYTPLVELDEVEVRSSRLAQPIPRVPTHI